MKKINTLIFLFVLSITTGFSQMAPDFTFTDITGESHTLSETLAEGKVVLLDFFFVSCPPCIEFAPEIESIIEDYEGSTLEVWALSDRDQDATIAGSIFNSTHEHHKVGGVVGGGYDIKELYADSFNFTGWPTYAIICNDGSVVWDIWPLSPGANEIRSQLTEACGVMASPTGVSEISGLKGAQLFPNPAADYVSVTFELEENTRMSVAVLNTVGQTVKSLPASEYGVGSQQIDLDVSALSAGLYMLKMESADGVKTFNVMISK